MKHYKYMLVSYETLDNNAVLEINDRAYQGWRVVNVLRYENGLDILMEREIPDNEVI